MRDDDVVVEDIIIFNEESYSLHVHYDRLEIRIQKRRAVEMDILFS